MKIRGWFKKLGAAVAVIAMPAMAGAAVTYDFTALSSFAFNGVQYTGSFSVTRPSFITPDASIPVAELTSCSITASNGETADCTHQDFLGSIVPGYETVSLGINSPSFQGGIFYYFDAGSFEALGTYDTVFFGSDQQGRLVVSGIPSPTPEPAGWLMMITGFGAIGGAIRLRAAARKPASATPAWLGLA